MRSTTQQLKQALASDALEQCARQCGIIGDVTKLKICYLLKHCPGLSVTEIAELAETSVSNVSHSLGKMRAANIVKSRKEAQTVYYYLTENSPAEVLLEFAQ